jgi:hypothetical protein
MAEYFREQIDEKLKVSTLLDVGFFLTRCE